MEIRNLTQVDGTNKAYIFHLQNGENVSLPCTKIYIYIYIQKLAPPLTYLLNVKIKHT